MKIYFPKLNKGVLYKCPDRFAVVYFVKPANFLREATLT